jgi:hypothetical protein
MIIKYNMDLTIRYDTAITQIAATRHKKAKRDLVIMLRNVERKLNELDKESVECRRCKKTTSRYETLATECQQLLTNLEQHIVLARLMGG